MPALWRKCVMHTTIGRLHGEPLGRPASATQECVAAGIAAVGVLTATLLSACGDEGKPKLNWYINPDGVDTFVKWAEECSTDEYDIEIQLLPTSATDQRVQLARRLAAEDPSTDLMNLDPVFVPEFANAGWLAEVEGDVADEVLSSVESEGGLPQGRG